MVIKYKEIIVKEKTGCVLKAVTLSGFDHIYYSGKWTVAVIRK